MYWNHNDKLLLKMIREFGEKEVEPYIEKATTLFLKLPEEKQMKLIIFGNYDPSIHSFIWTKEIKQIQYDMILNHYKHLFRDLSTLKKLFQDKVSLPSNYQNVIPYLLKLLNSAFYVVRIPLNNMIYFAFVKIPLKDKIPYKKFADALFAYRVYNMSNKKKYTISHKLKNKKIAKTRNKKD
jgi:hypothetical protein